MASLRNAISRETHKERSQPRRRQQLGFLEKHKDYVKRARDYHRKEDQLTRLRRKAEDRNPDEFYFKMVKSKTKDGIQRIERDGALDVDTVKLMKTQDSSYVATKRSVELKRAEKLQEELHFITGERMGKHTVFVDEDEEAEAFDAAEHFDTAPELMDRAFNRPRKEALAASDVMVVDADGALSRRERQQQRRKRGRRYAELGEALKRARKLDRVRAKIDVQKAVMGPGRKHKVKDAEDGVPPVYKWKRKRAK